MRKYNIHIALFHNVAHITGYPVAIERKAAYPVKTGSFVIAAPYNFRLMTFVQNPGNCKKPTAGRQPYSIVIAIVHIRYYAVGGIVGKPYSILLAGHSSITGTAKGKLGRIERLHPNAIINIVTTQHKRTHFRVRESHKTYLNIAPAAIQFAFAARAYNYCNDNQGKYSKKLVVHSKNPEKANVHFITMKDVGILSFIT